LPEPSTATLGRSSQRQMRFYSELPQAFPVKYEMNDQNKKKYVSVCDTISRISRKSSTNSTCKAISGISRWTLAAGNDRGR
jgi:hypothetical protein